LWTNPIRHPDSVTAIINGSQVPAFAAVTQAIWHTSCVSTQTVREPSAAEFEAAAETLKLLADPTRLRVVWALLHGEHSVNELADHVGVRPTAVSQHLAKLRLAGLVRSRRAGNHIFYAAENEHIERLAAEALLQADHLVAGASHHRKAGRIA